MTSLTPISLQNDNYVVFISYSKLEISYTFNVAVCISCHLDKVTLSNLKLIYPQL